MGKSITACISFLKPHWVLWQFALGKLVCHCNLKTLTLSQTRKNMILDILAKTKLWSLICVALILMHVGPCIRTICPNFKKNCSSKYRKCHFRRSRIPKISWEEIPPKPAPPPLPHYKRPFINITFNILLHSNDMDAISACPR